MVTFTLSVEMRGDALTEAPATELARMIREVADRIEGGDLEGLMKDVNGNSYGLFGFGQ